MLAESQTDMSLNPPKVFLKCSPATNCESPVGYPVH